MAPTVVVTHRRRRRAAQSVSAAMTIIDVGVVDRRTCYQSSTSEQLRTGLC